MKSCKKLLCMFLCVVMALSLLAGCRKEEPTEPTTEAATEPTVEPIIYSITYVPNGGDLPYDADYDFTLEDPAELAEPERPNYDFVGWFEEEDCSGYLYTDTVGETGDKIYYAKWAPTEFAITYDLDGGAIAADAINPSYYTVESEEITLNNPTKTGYTFVGWEDNSKTENDIAGSASGTAAAEVSEEETDETDVSRPQTKVTIPKGSYGKKSFTAIWQSSQRTTGARTSGGSGGGHTHSYSTVKKVEATCFNEEYTVKRCSCGHKYKDVTGKALEHEWLDWVLVKEENLEENGIEKRSCEVCHIVESRFIDELEDVEESKTE